MLKHAMANNNRMQCENMKIRMTVYEIYFLKAYRSLVLGFYFNFKTKCSKVSL